MRDLIGNAMGLGLQKFETVQKIADMRGQVVYDPAFPPKSSR